MKQIFKMLTKPSSERIASLKSTFPQPLIFGVVSTNRKLVPNRVEIWSMFNKVQVVELILIQKLYHFPDLKNVARSIFPKS